MKSKRYCNDARIFRNSIRVCIDPDGSCLALRTYSRERGRKGRFLIPQDTLLAWYEGGRERSFFDTDCGNILELRIVDENALFHITWLRTDSLGNVDGFQQRFSLPESKLSALLYAHKALRHLHHERAYQAKIHTECVLDTLRRIQETPLVRRAFIKAMRDCFQWRDEEVYLYPDWRNSFYFRTASGYPSCGGLILHDTTVRTPNGPACKFYYSVHT